MKTRALIASSAVALLALTGCSDAKTTPSDSSTAPAPAPTMATASPSWTTNGGDEGEMHSPSGFSTAPGTAHGGDAATAPQKLYSLDPAAGQDTAWRESGAKLGIITSPAEIATVIAAFPQDKRQDVSKALQDAAAQEPPTEQHPWYVFDATGCEFQLGMEMVEGNPKITINPPKAQQNPCLVAEWGAAVYRYDASKATMKQPQFTAKKAG